MFSKPTVMGSSRAKGKPRKIKNVVIFGETGVGKSSLINLIAGEDISETSSSAVGCTLNCQRYLLRLGDQRFAVWDTAGLDEGTRETVPAEKVVAYLKQFLRNLAKARSIDLLVYCVRGTRVRSALLANYHLFYSAICRKKVPIAVVITGLEDQEDDMDTWWLENERQFLALQMRFDNYACVTTLQSPARNAMLEERRSISKDALIKMITSTCRIEQWMPPERTWAKTAFPDIRAILSSRDGNRVRVRVVNVIMCDVTRCAPDNQSVIKRSVTFQSPITLSLSFTRMIGLRSPMSVVDGESRSKLPFNVAMKRTSEHLFRVHQVPRKRSLSGGKEVGMIAKRGAELLIFCVEKKIGGCRDVKLQWDHFNFTYGGELSPQIIIIIGATDQHSAEEWWNGAVLGGAVTKPGDAFIAHWPVNEPFAEAEARGRLRDLINTCCIDCSKVNFEGDELISRRRTNSIPPWMRPPRNSDADKPVTAWQDVLTEWGVWEHIPTEGDVVTRPVVVRDVEPGQDDPERGPFRPPGLTSRSTLLSMGTR